MKLTDEQIAELAPEWAEFYYINVFRDIVFESEEFFVIYYTDEGDFSETYGQPRYGIDENSKPIPRKQKPFDITQHEWSDIAIGQVVVDDCNLIIEDYDWDVSSISINKQDAIAIAKHFQLTAEDLK